MAMEDARLFESPMVMFPSWVIIQFLVIGYSERREVPHVHSKGYPMTCGRNTFTDFNTGGPKVRDLPPNFLLGIAYKNLMVPACGH
jgi:hypothetical protein